MKYFRLLTKILFGWDWVVVRWSDRADFRRVRFTNVGKPYVRHLCSTYFLDEDHGRKIIGDTFEYPKTPSKARLVA